MTKLTNEQARMTRGSKEYNKSAAQIKQLKGIIAEHNKALTPNNQKMSFFGRLAEGFNRFEQMAVTAVAAIVGIGMVIKSTIQAFADFDEALTDTIKVTRLTKEQGKELAKSLGEIDTRTSVNELLNLAWVAGKLGINGKESVQEFVEASNQIGVALARDLGGTEAAIRDLGKLTDIFHLKSLYSQREAILKVGSAINELGMASTAAEGYLVNFAKRTAGIAPQAGVGIEDILGLAATLDALGQKAEMSSTAYSKLMVSMTKNTNEFASVAQMSVDDFTNLFNLDANEAMVRVFEGMNKNADGFKKMVSIMGDLEIDGQRMTSVFGALAKNTKMLRTQQDLSNKSFAEGISVTREYNLKNNTAQAQLDKYRKRFVALQVELGERMMPLWGNVIKKASTLLKVIGVSFEFIMKYGKEIALLAITITAYTLATKIATYWTKKHGEATLFTVVAQKLQSLAFRAQFAAIALYNTAIALLAGKTKVAAIQFRAFSAALMANPIGIVVGAIVALGAALYLYAGRLTAAQKLQKTLNNINLTAEKQIVEQRLEMEQLLKIAKDVNNTTAERLKALQTLNQISPEHIGNLTLETINTDAATTATNKYIESLRKKAQLQASQEKLVEIEKQLLDVREGELGFWDKAQGAGIAYALGLRTAGAANKDAADIEEFRTKKITELNLQKEKLLEINDAIIKADLKAQGIVPDEPTNDQLIIAKQKELDLAKKMPETNDAEREAREKKIAAISNEIVELRKNSKAYEENNDLIKEQEDLLASANLMPASSKTEITVRNKTIEEIEQKLSQLKELGTSKQGDSGKKARDEAEKKKLDALEASNNLEKAIINKRFLDGLTSEKQYKDELFNQELKFHAGKLKIYKAGSKEYQDAVNEALELQVEADLKLKELQLEAQQELANAKIENIRDEFDRLEQEELQHWEDEKTALELRLIDKENLNSKELAINQAINDLIYEKEKIHQQKMRDLNTGKSIAEKEQLVDVATPFDTEFAPLEEMQLMFDAKKALIEAQYASEKELAAGNNAFLLAAEKKHNDALIQLKLDLIDAEWQQKEQRIAAGQQFIGALSGMVEQETALGKALFLFNQGLAIAEIWMNIGKANAKAVALSPVTGGMPMGGYQYSNGRSANRTRALPGGQIFSIS